MIDKSYFLNEIEKIKKGYWLEENIAKKILNSKGKIKISLNANKNYKVYDSKELKNKIGIKNLKKVKGEVYYYFDGKKLFKLAIFDKYYYKLIPTELAPTVEISGVKMHRVKDINPWEDAKQKVLSLKPKGVCLDTCMGLGYTAIWLSKFCDEVYTIEIDENMIEMTKWNPWSYDLYYNDKIKIIHGDSFEIVKKFNDEYFDYILHDPPTIFMAGKLYSEEFYKELYRILKSSGKVYHYTGYRGEKRGFDIIGKAMQRMNRVGFKTIRRRDVLGLIAIKP